MKRVAVLIYPHFCNYELSVALAMLSMADKPVTIFAKSQIPVRSEEGLSVVCDLTLNELDIDNYDSLLLPGSANLEPAITDEETMAFISKFNDPNICIGAISCAPLLLLKNGMLANKRYMAGVTKEWLLEEGFTIQEMSGMLDVPELDRNPVPEGFIRQDNIVTSVAWHFREWAMEFGRMIGIEVYPKAFGLESNK